MQFFDQLTNKLQSPEFLERLKDMERASQLDPPPSTSQEEETADDVGELVPGTQKPLTESLCRIPRGVSCG